MHSVLISGANRGIGLEFVRQIIARQNPQHVFAGCRSLDNIKELKKLASNEAAIKIIQLDVTNDSSIVAAVQQVSTIVKNQGLSMIINNAGIYNTESLEDVNRETMQHSFDVNATGPLILTREFLHLLKQASNKTLGFELSCTRSAVINITSGYGSLEGNTKGGIYPYRSSKIALNMVNRSLSIDLRPHNILVVALDPGWVQTDMGGKNAHLTTEDCVSKLLDVMQTLCEKHTGRVVTYHGTILPF